MRKTIKDKRYAPLMLKNRIELQGYQAPVIEINENESLNGAVFAEKSHSVITHSYAEFNIKL